jgi:hypothetical protein
MKLFFIYSLTLLTLVFMQVSTLNEASNGAEFLLELFRDNPMNQDSFLDYIGNLHRDRISRVERLRRIAFAQEKARQAKELRYEEERDRIFRKYLNSRQHASFLSDFHTLRY